MIEVFIVTIFIISLIISYQEIKKYYQVKKELALTNDMYITTTLNLSILGIVCIAINLSCIILFLNILIHNISY